MSKSMYFFASQFSRLEGEKFFIKTFLVDSSINSNRWAVTEQALRENIASFIGKPIILTPDFGHPKAESGDTLLQDQEPYRVGNIIDIGIDEINGKGWAIAEITKKSVIEMLTDTGINFVSPSIIFGEEDLILQDGVEVATKFEGAHLAIVKDPAYGIQKAQIKGHCQGTSGTCLSQLQKVQASVETSKCGNYITIKQGSTQRVIQASKCVEDCIRKKADMGVTIDDQAIAICFSECGESREAECVVDQLGNCVVNSSLSDNDAKNELMTAQEDEEKEKEEKAKKAQEDEEEKKKEEEARKAQEEEEKKKEEESKRGQNDEEEKVDDIAKLKAELHELKKEIEDSTREAKAKPIVDKIVTAKVRLNLIKESESQKEYDSLISLPTAQLNTIASQYAQVSNAERPYSVLTLGASTESTSGDDLFIKLGSVD